MISLWLIDGSSGKIFGKSSLDLPSNAIMDNILEYG